MTSPCSMRLPQRGFPSSLSTSRSLLRLIKGVLSRTTGKLRVSGQYTTCATAVMKPACTSIPVVIVDLDDEREFAELVSLYVQRNRPASEKIGSIGALEEWIQKSDPDQLPVAFCFPDTRGCKTFTAITAYSDEPRVFLSGSIRDMEYLLGIGADERYDLRRVSKDSLRARLTAIGEKASRSRKRRVSYAGIELDCDSLKASANGIDLGLTPTEFQLMRLFVNNPKKVFTRDRLLTVTAGDRAEISDRSVDAHIKNLRKKLLGAVGRSVEILTVYGVGYRLE